RWHCWQRINRGWFRRIFCYRDWESLDRSRYRLCRWRLGCQGGRGGLRDVDVWCCLISVQGSLFPHFMGNRLEVYIAPQGIWFIHLPGASTALIFDDHALQRIFHLRTNSLIIVLVLTGQWFCQLVL